MSTLVHTFGNFPLKCVLFKCDFCWRDLNLFLLFLRSTPKSGKCEKYKNKVRLRQVKSLLNKTHFSNSVAETKKNNLLRLLTLLRLLMICTWLPILLLYIFSYYIVIWVEMSHTHLLKVWISRGIILHSECGCAFRMICIIFSIYALFIIVPWFIQLLFVE